jgi:hypothetical protein
MQGDSDNLLEGIFRAKDVIRDCIPPRGKAFSFQRVGCSLHVVVKPVRQWVAFAPPQTGEGRSQGTLVGVL